MINKFKNEIESIDCPACGAKCARFENSDVPNIEHVCICCNEIISEITQFPEGRR